MDEAMKARILGIPMFQPTAQILPQASYLIPHLVVEQKTEEDKAVDESEELGKYCHLCDEIIPMVEQAVQVEVVIGFKDGDHVQCYTCYDDDGDFKYTPLHFHEECWDCLMEDIRMLKADEPPVEVQNEVLKCFICDSSITEGEEFSSIEPGEIHVSPREPEEGVVEIDFFKYGCPKPVCFGCMAIVDEMVEGEEEEEDWNG